MANDCCSLRIEGGEDITINQGEGINLAAGVYAYDSDGEPVPLYISPSEIDKCDVGEHVITYTASGKDNQMLPSLLCGENEVSVPEQCGNLNTVTKKRIVTIKEAEAPVIRWDNPTWIDPNEEFDPLDGVWARDDNGNRIEDINYYGKMDDMAEGDIASFETDLTDPLKSLQVFLDPIQDLNGYDAPWVGGAGANKLPLVGNNTASNNGVTAVLKDGVITLSGTASGTALITFDLDTAINLLPTDYKIAIFNSTQNGNIYFVTRDGSSTLHNFGLTSVNRIVSSWTAQGAEHTTAIGVSISNGVNTNGITLKPMVVPQSATDPTVFEPYSNICPISGHDEVDVSAIDEQKYNFSNVVIGKNWIGGNDAKRATLTFGVEPSTRYKVITEGGNFSAILFIRMENYTQITNIPINPPFNGYITTESNCNKVIVQFQKDTAITASDFDDFKCSISKEYESYHQDIEATYTPTVQENTPYLLKQTGDVGGDRETIELVGGTVAWNQLAPSTDSYANNNCTHTWSDELITVTPSNYTNNACGVFKSNALIVGHKYFISADFYLDNQGKVRVGSGVTATGSVFDKTVSANTWTTHSAIVLCPSGQYSTSCIFYLRAQESGWTSGTYKTKNRQIIDLTQMFGSTIADYIYSLEQANAGDGVAFFRKLFQKAYYPYNTGELISVKTTAHKTVGKNFSEESFGYANMFSRYIPKGTVVTASCATPSGGNAQINYYREDRTRIDYWTLYTDLGNGRRKVTFTLLEDAYYWAWTGYQTEKYQLEIGSDATSYEPYVENTYPLDSDLELRGMLKLDISNKLYYDGDTYKHDGSVGRKYVEITLTGTETIGSYDSGTLYGFSIVKAGFPAPKVSTADSSNNITSIIANHGYTGGYSQAGAHVKTKAIAISKWSSAYYMYFSVDDYADATAFKTWLATQYSNGNPVKIVYELATPTTETADAFEEIQKVTPIYGTEEFVDNRAVPMPVGNNTQYLTRDIYGGYIDLVNCKLVLDRAVTVFDGSSDEDWAVYGGGQFVYCRDLRTVAKRGSSLLAPSGLTSNMFVPKTSSSITNNYIMIDNDGDLRVKTDAFNMTSITDTRAWLSDNLLQVCYELVTPLEYDIPCHEINAFIGQNNVWSEDGRVRVIFTKSIPESGEFSYPLDGTYTIEYWVEDECGNETTEERQILVGDYGEPE